MGGFMKKQPRAAAFTLTLALIAVATPVFAQKYNFDSYLNFNKLLTLGGTV
jgi:hypothetical protein